MFDKVMHIMHSAYIHTELVTSHFRISFNTLVSRVIIITFIEHTNVRRCTEILTYFIQLYNN